MAKSVDKLKNFINSNLNGWQLQDLPSEIETKDANIIVSPNGEKIFVSFVNINITGTDRSKPQIRIILQGQYSLYEWALKNNMRFFLMTIFTQDLSMAKNFNNINPQEYVVSIESNLEGLNGRVDIRSMYDYLDAHPNFDFIRCSAGSHSTSLSQASFIKIEDKGVVNKVEFENYLQHFDSRPYVKCIRNMVQYVKTTTSVSKASLIKMPHNLLINGAPGTGKSYYIDKMLCEIGKFEETAKAAQDAGDTTDIKILEQTAKSEFFNTFVHRVTFYEDYTYANFVGCYKPVPVSKVEKIQYDGKEGEMTGHGISYEYEAGPFIDVYVKAIQNKENNYYLVVEEINRANAASVFGDMFQLLDRKNGISEYSINPEPALAKYLEDNLGICEKMSLPDNLYIWATLNSADQGVFPLDTAFKRRWSSLYIDITTPRASDTQDGTEIAIALTHDKKLQYIKWDSFRTAINSVILSRGFDEDRCIGAWYFTDEELLQIEAYMMENILDKRRNMPNPLVDKLLAYLRQDVFRTNPSAIFKTITVGSERLPSLSDLRKAIIENKNILDILSIHLEDSEWKDKKDDFIVTIGSDEVDHEK